MESATCSTGWSETFSYIKIDDESINGACTLINYKGKLREFSLQIPGKALTRVEIQGFQEVKRLRPRVYTFQDYAEDVKLMKSRG
ncbi:hypothetical protein F2Q70_00026864 [Brassica cretica]|uniref:Uncharacterized protein n=1 Tax=Brassica cretica TaxID=69181 RepID=A0A8S9L8Z8_BRACR|nr:hypothetical protein F2Q70_00026864 [Brassica cretica]KAF3579818.1 hypothetical protein DY000_02032760 [Brassica cretica]